MLRQRAEKEEAAEQALAMAHNEYNRRLDLLQDTRQRLEAAFTVADKNQLDVLEVMNFSLYRTSLTKKISSQERDVREAGLVVEYRRGEAVRARQELQVMEKLKDKQYEIYKSEEAAREQKEVDELALYAYQRVK